MSGLTIGAGTVRIANGARDHTMSLHVIHVNVTAGQQQIECCHKQEYGAARNFDTRRLKDVSCPQVEQLKRYSKKLPVGGPKTLSQTNKQHKV